jgi:hypothetical protein
METKICKICEIEKPLESFYVCHKCHKGRQATCKICILEKRNKKDKPIHQFNKEFRKSEAAHFSMAGCTKQDYMDMYELLRDMGYDVDGDVHQQFLNRHNQNEKYPMKYKKRKINTDNHYLPDGSVSPEARKSYYIKKTPSE